MRAIVLASLVGLASAGQLVKKATGKCMDIKIFCEDGTDTKGCQRQKPEDIKKGAKLQMWECKDKRNQNWELINGRIRNKLTGLCIDIMAECVDDDGNVQDSSNFTSEQKKACKRQTLDELKSGANIQLWTCRQDTPEGFASRSFGNQKFNLMMDGTFENTRTGLCLGANPEDAKDTNGAPVHIVTCKEKDDTQIFEWRTTDAAIQWAADDAAKQAAAPATEAPAAATEAPAATRLFEISDKVEVSNKLVGSGISSLAGVGFFAALVGLISIVRAKSATPVAPDDFAEEE